MRYLKCIGLLTVLFLSVFVITVEAASSKTVINFSSLDKSQLYSLHGTLYMPEKISGPCPAVVVVHGTAGIDSRGAFYRDAILDAGIAFFEVDFMHGIYTGPADRPKNDSFVPMAFAALKELRKLPDINPNQIGIMGFSLGGGVTVRTAIEAFRKLWMGSEKGFAAHAAFYPVTGPFIPKLQSGDLKMTGAPLTIFYGSEDSYGDGTNVPVFKRLLMEKYKFEITTYEYAGAQHGFNRNGPPVRYADPAAINQSGYMAWDEKAAKDSLARVVPFLRDTLTAK